MNDWLFGAGWALSKRVPEPVARAAFAAVGDQIWRRRGAGVQRLEANLRRASPAHDDAQLRALSRRALRSYLRYWCETFRLPTWSVDRVVSSVVTDDEHYLRDAYAAGDGVVIALPHTANWDHAGAWVALSGMPFTTVAERLRPERLYQRFVAYRESLGMEVLPLTGGDGATFHTLVERARAGRLICLVADRDLSSSGVEVDLLGEAARLPAGPAVLSRSTRAVLLPATLSYQGALLRIRFHRPVPRVAGADGARIMTQQVADAFSAGIRAHPEDWHMLQRVFAADL
ncbi:MAG: phosphatidylinositol mannoside acyltransferase [Propionibacteriales bacterium]|nr:phosphatidylinositol mannoside acyltransferase [Propionibacteriales bacterium]